MVRKYILTILLLITFVSPLYVIHAEAGSVGTKVENATSSFFATIGNFIEKYTPKFLERSAISATNITEEFRQDLVGKLENKKTNLKLEIKAFDHTEKSVHETTWKDKLSKTLKYIELFFTTIFLVILSSLLLFYGISITILVLLIRFIVRLLFG